MTPVNKSHTAYCFVGACEKKPPANEKGEGAMHIFHWFVTLFFSGTAVSLLSYQAVEIVQAIIDFLVDRHS
ncbi:hypothetical protein [Saccharococcus caldoxylosilyticus]|uniref:hypothetical protein n=1 Tax=Saccharococcus caldoxylosilyticus TaxID=81408 RepID=UPI001FCB50C8|nr:hypothetical protein [Parageobacillus caldoxylosilyticus]